MKALTKAILMVVLVISLIATSCIAPQTNSTSTTNITSLSTEVNGGPSQPIIVNLSISEPPTLGKEVQVNATYSMLKEYPLDIADNIDARIILPDGFTLIQGNLANKRPISKSNPITLNATIIANKTGDWEIEARSDYVPSEGSYYVGLANLYIRITDTDATVSKTPFPRGQSFPIQNATYTPQPGIIIKPLQSESPVTKIAPEQRSGATPKIFPENSTISGY